MRIYLKQNVYEATLDRLDYIYRDFDQVVVWFSGGKDSTVILNLALEAAERAGKLPVPVHWIDQEGEWEATAEYAREVMTDPRVTPYHHQMPMLLFNATSTSGEDEWLRCWDESEAGNWMREKEPYAVTENVYGTERFGELFTAIAGHHYPDRTAFLGGVRCEESPQRTVGLTGQPPVWKWITWGKKLNQERDQYTLYPIYDWSYQDVWKCIHDNGWRYNKLYDYQFQYGTDIRGMRCSNVHHETAVQALYYMQELEPETWAKLCKRIKGIRTAGILQESGFRVSEVPPMFSGWREYRDYLFENLITDEAARKKLTRLFAYGDRRFAVNELLHDRYCHRCVSCILRNDWEGTILNNFDGANERSYLKWRRGEKVTQAANFFRINPYYKYDVEQGLVDGLEADAEE